MTFPTAPPEANAAFAAPVEVDDPVEIRDFTVKRKRILFRVDDDIFEAHPLLGLGLLQQLARLIRTLGELRGADGSVDEQRVDAQIEAISQVFNALLLPECAPRFISRVKGNTIDIREQLIPIIYYLLERYGIRPTQQSSDSSTGSPSETGGTSSEAGASPAGSASETWPPTSS